MERISLINIEMLPLYKLTCPVHRPTTRSAMKQSSVSPERWDTITPHPAACDILHASILSVTDPIWLTFNNKQLHAFLSIPVRTRLGFVTRRSSLRNRKHLYKFSIRSKDEANWRWPMQKYGTLHEFACPKKKKKKNIFINSQPHSLGFFNFVYLKD